jgi:outer membrane phospholipase A
MSKMISSKSELENAIIVRNQNHSKQSPATPFATNPTLSSTIQHDHPNCQLDSYLDHTFIQNYSNLLPLSLAEETWIKTYNALYTKKSHYHSHWKTLAHGALQSNGGSHSSGRLSPRINCTRYHLHFPH